MRCYRRGVIHAMNPTATAAGSDSENEWLLCPVCKSKTRIKLRRETTLTNFPLFCPKCKQETLVNVQELKITVINEPDA